jgi:hypothetical protein
MAKYSGNIDGHVVVAELGISGHWYTEVDGHRMASGFQLVADRPIEFKVGDHKVLVRFSGQIFTHIEVFVDGEKIYSV